MIERRRYRAVTPVSDFSITQKVRTVLVEDGHSDLVIEAITGTVHDLEEALGHAKKRIKILEDIERERPKPPSDTGMQRIVRKSLLNILFGWSKPVAVAFVGALGTAAFAGLAWVARMVWLGIHAKP